MKNDGFTLIELMISTAVFSVVTGIALSFSVAATQQIEMNTTWASVLTGEVHIIEKIEQELAMSSVNYVGEDSTGTEIDDTIIVNPNSIQFRKVIGYNTDTYNIVWSDFITYQLAPNRGEVIDGVDNNGNGYVDEMCFERVGPDGQGFFTTRIYFSDPYKLQFSLNGNLLTITIDYVTSQDTSAVKSINIALPTT